MRNPSSGDCLDTMGSVKGDEAVKKKIGIYSCHGQGGNQVCGNTQFKFLKVVSCFYESVDEW